jgi:hypothetical protein
MNTYYLTVKVQIKVESNLSIEEVIHQFGSETDYDFKSTNDVEVLETEIYDVE